MIIGKTKLRELIVETELVKNYVDLEVQLQPCGFDLTVGDIFELRGDAVIDFDNSYRKVPTYLPLTKSVLGYWALEPGTYMVMFNEELKLPLTLMGVSTQRSTIKRCGGHTTVGFWDPGYNGAGYCNLTVTYPLKIRPGARICQIVFYKVTNELQMTLEGAALERYEGVYQKENVVK